MVGGTPGREEREEHRGSEHPRPGRWRQSGLCIWKTQHCQGGKSDWQLEVMSWLACSRGSRGTGHGAEQEACSLWSIPALPSTRKSGQHGGESATLCSILRPSVAASSQGMGVPAGPRAYNGSWFRGQRGRGGARLQSSEPVPALGLPSGPRPLQPRLAGSCESHGICRGRLSRAPS